MVERGLDVVVRACWLLTAWAVLLGVPLPSLAATPQYTIEPAPAWIGEVQPASPDPAALKAIKQSSYHLLIDSQARLGLGAREYYQRFVTTALAADGVAAIANLEIVFDPSWQSLVLHAIDVVRDGQVVHRLPGAAINLLQREQDLDRRIYNGTLTASVLLDDVRIGDIVDYSYSLRGSNPVFGGHESDAVATRFAVAVARSHLRLLVPVGRQLTVETRNGTMEPTQSVRDGYRIYELDQRDLPALTMEKGTPAWYDAWPSLQWSDYAGWSGVVQWAIPFYRVPADPGSEVQAQIKRIASAESSPEGRLLAALRFVQGEIRYTGVAVGTGSHLPSAPAVTLQRRFGDCKDKTLLLMALLEGLGIEARAALVNTEIGRALANRVPAATLFDHVIVQAIIAGEVVWLDPTRARQNAGLAHLDQPDFDLALLVDAGAVGLTSMRNASFDLSRTEITMRIDGSGGFDKSPPMSLVMIVYGAQADVLRRRLAASGETLIEKGLLNYYARYFPGIEVDAPLKVIDDESINRITFSQSYRLRDLATWNANERRYTAAFGIRDLDELLAEPAFTRREMPLLQKHPVRLSLTTDLIMPSAGAAVAASTNEVNDPAFRFKRNIEATPTGARIHDEYESLVDHVDAVDMPRYVANLGKARTFIGFHLTWFGSDGAPGSSVFEQFNWLLLFVALIGTAGWIWLARRLWRYDPLARSAGTDPRLCGIGGWLLLPGLLLLWYCFSAGQALLARAHIFSTGSWAALTQPGGSRYDPMWAPILLFDLISRIGIIVLGALLLVLYFKKRTSLPRLYIAFLATFVVQVGITVLLDSGLSGHGLDWTSVITVARDLPALGIWTWYFFASERVGATFTRRLVYEECSAPTRSDGEQDVPALRSSPLALVDGPDVVVP